MGLEGAGGRRGGGPGVTDAGPNGQDGRRSGTPPRAGVRAAAGRPPEVGNACETLVWWDARVPGRLPWSGRDGWPDRQGWGSGRWTSSRSSCSGRWRSATSGSCACGSPTCWAS
ncbi:hypothetical protein DKG34_01685 [Streptomyces sp. NWU49]|uniref:Uncharacterized protein n=1 Tax=Streptomyces viridosporus T7A TaxID=665577 RepID=A0ABX6ADU2_STRVD|nr:hypothetical protein DKG34_01685 [Streptomyces sp. NWU49]QEU85415.1 hypothetical protein CP969_12295 [Streptomyces viridosporus T7A]